jgi:hypothetical protein
MREHNLQNKEITKEHTIHFKLSDLENEGLYAAENVDLKLVNEQRKYLSPDARELFTRDEIRRIIKKYGEHGISIPEITVLTGFDRKTIQKHLDKLNGLREIYSQKKGEKISLYYPNGKPIHQIGSKRVGDANPVLDISIAQGSRNSLYFYIIEKRYSIIEGEVSEGAVMLPLERIDEFIVALKELKRNVEVMHYG